MDQSSKTGSLTVEAAEGMAIIPISIEVSLPARSTVTRRAWSGPMFLHCQDAWQAEPSSTKC